jgi:hypothetical protein
MRAAWSVAVGLALVFALVLGIQAEEKKEVTLKGKVTCAKCDLKKADACQTVIVVKEKGKDQIYYFAPASHKKFHAGICKKAKEGTVKGTVSKDGDMMVIDVTSVDYK